MESDDDAEDSGIAEDPIQPQGPRRSTFTPALNQADVSGQTTEGQNADEQAYDDDALASALAEQFAPFGQTGMLPVVSANLEDFPAPTGAPIVFGTDENALPTEQARPSVEQLSRFAPPTASPTGPVWSPPGPTRQSYTPPAEFVDPELVLSAPEPPDPEPEQPEAPMVDDPAQAAPLPAAETGKVEPLPVAGPESEAEVSVAEPARFEPSVTPWVPPTADSGLPAVPERRSLADDELVRSLETEAAAGSTLDALATFEAQLRLRQQDAADFDRWQSTMRDIGTPEAIDSIEAAIPTFTDVINLPTPEQLAGAAPAQVWPAREAPQPDTTVHDAESDSEQAPAEPEPESEPQTETEIEIDEAPVVYELIEPAVTPTPSGGIPPLASLEFVKDSPVDPIASAREADQDADEFVDAAVPHLDEVPASPERPHLPGFNDLIGFDDLLSGSIRTVPDGPDAQVSPPVDLVVPPIVDSPPVASGSMTTPGLTGLTESPAHTAAPPTVTVAEPVERTSVFWPERAGVEPTRLDQRVGRAARMFWLWFATNSSLISLAFGGVLLSLGMSVRQAIVAALIGVAISFLPLGLGTLAGKWSGQPTMIVSRASFGVIGNVVPASLAVITRVFWGAVMLWLAGASTARILIGNRSDGTLLGLGETKITALAIALGFVIALVVAVLGYALFSRVQLVLSIVSAVLVIAFIVVSWHAVDVTAALTVGDGPWVLVLTGVVLVVSFLGVVWATSSADLARYQRPSSSGAQASLWAPFGATLPAFLLIAYGALLAASSPKIARGLVATPLDTIAALTPSWYPAPLLLGTVLSLLVGVVLSIYSGGFAVQAVGLRVPRAWSTTIVGVLVFIVALVLTLTVGSMAEVFRDLTTTIAVPVAAWIGIFAAEMILRRRRFDNASLLRRGGAYSDVNWVNLAMLVVASVVGFGLTTATVGWLNWQGYLFEAFRVPLDGHLAGTDVGVLVALLLGLLTPFVSGVRTIRKQEQQPRFFA